MRAVKFQQVYKECWQIFKNRALSHNTDFIRRIEWMWEILNSIIYWEEWRYDNIVREYSSIETQFIKNKEYVTAENDYILQVMKMKVWVVRQEYAWLDLRTNLKNYIDLIKFKYLELIDSSVKN